MHYVVSVHDGHSAHNVYSVEIVDSFDNVCLGIRFRACIMLILL